MASSAFLAVVLATTRLSAALAAEEPRVQPVLLPMTELLKRLERTEEWVLLPLDEYRAMVAAGISAGAATARSRGMGGAPPAGAWIESATIAGRLDGDRDLRLEAMLAVTSAAPGVTRCRIFAAAPARLGGVMLDGQPGLYAFGGDRLDLVVPGPGRHQVVLAWSAMLDRGDERARRGAVPLPIAGGVDLRLTSSSPGAFSGEAVAETPRSDAAGSTAPSPARSWRMIAPTGPFLDLAWHPGRLAASDAAVFGLRQSLQVVVQPGQRPFRWAARLEPRRGAMPAELVLTLPRAWVMTAPVAGVVGIEGRERVRLRIDPSAREIACDGFMAEDAPIDLPQVEGAAYAGGTVSLDTQAPLDYRLPAGWRDQASDGADRRAKAGGFARSFSVAEPGAGMSIAILPSDAGPACASSACVLLGPHAGDWTIEQTITIAFPGERLFALPLRLPAGWTLDSFTCDAPATIAELADGDEVSTLPAGSALTVRVPGGARALGCELRLKRSVAPGGDAAARGEVALASVPTARRSSQRVSLIAAPGLDARIAAGALWRLDANDGPVEAAAAPVRAELLATGAPGPITLTVAPTPAVADAEAVWYVLPALAAAEGAESWCRLDLRLRVRDGELDALELDAPLLRSAKLQLDDQLFVLSNDGGRLMLRARRPWRGEHLLRIEGPLDPAAAGSFPRIRLARVAASAAGADLPLRQEVVLQAPASADLVLKPGTGCTPVDEDDLPAWSKPIPGAPVFAAFRCLLAKQAELGGYALVQRPLAPAPRGFVDQLEVRTQVSAAGTLTLVRARIASPGAQALVLGLPAGARLSEATVDGVASAVRRQGDELVLPLPGRTQVQVALLFSGPPPHLDFRLALPRLGDLPVTRTAWSVAVDDQWRAEVVADPAAMPVIPVDERPAVRRGWLDPWRSRPGSDDVQTLPPAPQQRPRDPRALAEVIKPEVARGEPTLALAGHLYRGERIGSGGELRLRLEPLASLRAWDGLGRVLGLGAAALLVACCSWRRRLTLAAAAALLAVALHAWQIGAGPLLALCETTVVALPLAWAAVVLLRLAPRRGAVATTLLAIAALAGGPAGAQDAAPTDGVPLLMGYRHLDKDGLPQEVRVALTRARLTELWSRAHPQQAAAIPPCDLATGAALYTLEFSAGKLRGELRLPLAVLSAEWQQLRLPVLPGSVWSVRLDALGERAPAPSASTWSMDGGALVVSVAGRQQGVLVVELAVPLQAGGGGWSGAFPVFATRGGRVEVACAPEERLVPAITGLELTADPANAWRWSALLAPNGGEVAIAFHRAEAQPAKEMHLGLEQRLRAALAPGRIEWSGDVVISLQGSTLREATLAVPAGLTITAVDGPALASWRQQGGALTLAWSAAQSGAIALHAAGLVPRAGGAAEFALHLAGAERSTGRIDLVDDAAARFLRPEHPQSERAEPLPGSDLAVRWSDDPQRLVLAWEERRSELRLSEQCALIAGLDRVRVTALCTLAGRGGCDAVRLRLPEPWRLVGAPAGVSATVVGEGAARALLLRGDGAWSAGAGVAISLEAERGRFSDELTVPDLTPLDDVLAWERQSWLLGDAGDRRLRLAQPGQYEVLGVDAQAASMAANGVALRPGERWRLACERRAAPPPRIELVAEAAQVRVTASHYLVLGQERVRWWSRLVYDLGQGELRELRFTLPPGAALERLNAHDLGGFETTGREVVARLAAPARRSVILELELSVPLDSAGAAIAALVTPAGQIIAAQQVALVEEDDLGLLHLDAQGLEDDHDAPLLMPLPDGVDAKLVPHRWHALRPGWQLGVRREALATAPGVDGVATLVDAVTVIAPDGDLRGHAIWHVLNRTRQQLPLALPGGLALWETRVDGEVVRPRVDATSHGATGPALWLPVRPQRPGEAALRIEVTWRQRVAITGGFAPLMPVFPDLRVMQALWRLVPPAGFELIRRGGALVEGKPGDAEGDRARCVIDELQRLRTQGDLNDVGLRRLSDQLNGLDLELNDYLVGMQQLGGDQAMVQAARQAHQGVLAPAVVQAQREVIDAVNSNRAQVQQELQRIDNVYQGRQGRRKALGLLNEGQNWRAGAPAVSTGVADGDYRPRHQPEQLPWQDALTVAVNGSLGTGEAPPGYRAAGGGGLLGIDLLGEREPGGLVLRGQGGDLTVELALRRHAAPWWPWLALAAAAALAAVACFARGNGARG